MVIAWIVDRDGSSSLEFQLGQMGLKAQKNPRNRNALSVRAEKRSWAFAVTVFLIKFREKRRFKSRLHETCKVITTRFQLLHRAVISVRAEILHLPTIKGQRGDYTVDFSPRWNFSPFRGQHFYKRESLPLRIILLAGGEWVHSIRSWHTELRRTSYQDHPLFFFLSFFPSKSVFLKLLFFLCIPRRKAMKTEHRAPIWKNVFTNWGWRSKGWIFSPTARWSCVRWFQIKLHAL